MSSFFSKSVRVVKFGFWFKVTFGGSKGYFSGMSIKKFTIKLCTSVVISKESDVSQNSTLKFKFEFFSKSSFSFLILVSLISDFSIYWSDSHFLK